MSEADRTHVAIIGMVGRFGESRDLAGYWRQVRDGLTSVRTLTAEELHAAGEPWERTSDPAYVARHAPIPDPEWFDADFFGFSPLDATITDPQHRVFLESCWQALEDAGYPPQGADAIVGVYGGCKESRYAWLVESQRDSMLAIDEYRIGVGTGVDHLCMRVSHRLGLTGPSVTVMTTCSTSLVAVHQACQALLAGDCDIALAGGVAIRVPLRGIATREGGVISPEGTCRPFDAAADGTIGGDGVGVVVLKRLAEAIADGDCIRAVIRGSAVNNDGGDRAGYHAPSVSGQAALIHSALMAAEVDASTLDYVQTHGTATVVGDPIEIAGLTRAFTRGGWTRDAERRPRCVLGAVKANVGHTDAAAGVAGLFATVMALRDRILPPIANYQKPNPEIDFEQTPFTVLTSAAPWERRGHPRRAGVSSFGMGGTNAHVVVEEAPARPPARPGLPWRLLVLSARTPSALDASAAGLAAHLRSHPDLALDDVAYTLQVGRVPFAYRRVAVVTDHEDAVGVLSDRTPGRLVTGTGACHERPVLVEPDRSPDPHEPVGSELFRYLPGLGGAEPTGADAVSALTSFVRRVAVGDTVDGDPLRYIVNPRSTLRELLTDLGALWVAGASIRWAPLHEGQGRCRVSLPTYPFERQRYMVPMAAPSPARLVGEPLRPIEPDSVALLFEEVLGTPGVRPDDDFFALGGDSLVAAQLAVRLEELFGIAVPLDDVFDNPTPAALGGVVADLIAEETPVEREAP